MLNLIGNIPGWIPWTLVLILLLYFTFRAFMSIRRFFLYEKRTQKWVKTIDVGESINFNRYWSGKIQKKNDDGTFDITITGVTELHIFMPE